MAVAQKKGKREKLTQVDSRAAPGALETGKKTTNWAAETTSKAYEAAEKLYTQVRQAFKNQDEQSDRIEEYWNIYNAQPDENVRYTGNTNGYVPIVRDAINARTKRTLKQLFPANNKHVEAIAADGKTPHSLISLLEHYIRVTRLKSIVRSDLVSGDVTGQWNLMLDWHKSERSVRHLVKRNPIVDTIDGEDVQSLEIPDPTDEYDDLDTDEVIEQRPDIVDFATEDLAVIPPTVNDLQKAKAVAVRIRLSAEMVRQWEAEGTLILPKGTDIDDFCRGKYGDREKRNRAKKQAEDAGIKTQGTDKYALLFMVYTKLDFGSGAKESAIIYFAGENEICGILKNPLWSGKIPILSAPVNRVRGSFMGKSVIEAVKFMQWDAVDSWNMGQDSKMYSLLPVFAVDPLKNPQWASLVLGLAAVWPIAPGDVKPIQFAQLWKDSMQNVDAIKRQIWESLDVNEMMMGKMPAGRKNNQLMGQMQQEQATAITDHAERYEEEMLTPLVEMLFEFDQQFRDTEIDIVSRGELGVKAKMETVHVQQWGERLQFSWAGTAYVRSIQMMQQQIAWVNVVKSIPPQMMGGRRLDVGPFLEVGTENIFGPDLAPRILIDESNKFTVEPDVENQIMLNEMAVQVHEADNDQQHLQSHMRVAEQTGDPKGHFRAHIAAHVAALQTKREKMMANQQPKPGAPGAPPGAAPAGAAGTPRPGAQPAPPRPAQAPAGAIQADHMVGAAGRG